MSKELQRLTRKFNPATLSLSASARLVDNEQHLIEDLHKDIRRYADGDHVIREGELLTECYIVVSGWLSRRRSSLDGRRLAVNVYLPGDLFAVHLGFNRKALFDVAALEDSEIAVVPAEQIIDLATRHSRIGSALDWSAVRTLNIVSEHVFGLSARSAEERVLHLLLEFWCRLIVVGDATDNSFEMPLTQAEIGELAGLSLVAVNRAIQSLRQKELLTINKPVVVFQDVRACMDFCDFDPSFLETYEPRGAAKLETYI